MQNKSLASCLTVYSTRATDSLGVSYSGRFLELRMWRSPNDVKQKIQKTINIIPTPQHNSEPTMVSATPRNTPYSLSPQEFLHSGNMTEAGPKDLIDDNDDDNDQSLSLPGVLKGN